MLGRRNNHITIALIIALLLSMFGWVSADTGGEEIFNKIMENYYNVSGVYAHINQIIKTPLSSERYSLNIRAMKPGYMRVEYEKIEQLFVADGANLYIYDGSSKRVFRYILGDIESYTDVVLLRGYVIENYKIKLSKEEDNSLTLYGLSPELEYPVVRIWYDDDYYVERVGFDDGGGNVFEFEIVSADLSDESDLDIYEFEVPEGAVVEERGVIFPY